ncbi:STAS domain-containing protein [Kitasatospora sp. NPDC093806]|uniref:STAS domain-containing protein n=1 Tax=Kitasatospora sp. NPDC093806 TaxID=3155075 RepID=UPI003414F15D
MAHRPQRDRTDAIEQVWGFSVQTEPWAEGTVLALRGELDLDAVTDLYAALDAALATPGSVIVIDCAGLEFCDSSGLNLLVRARADAAAGGSRIELARPGPLLRRLLELTGAAEAFTIRETIPS